MGLDVYIYKVLKVDAHEHAKRLLADVDFRKFESESKMWNETFKDFILPRVEQHYDIEKYFRDLGLDPENYQYSGMRGTDDDRCLISFFDKSSAITWSTTEEWPKGVTTINTLEDGVTHIGYTKEIDVDSEAIPTFPVDHFIVYVEEVGYMRKNVNKEFYEQANTIMESGDGWEERYADFTDLVGRQALEDFIEKYVEDKGLAKACLLNKFEEGCFTHISW